MSGVMKPAIRDCTSKVSIAFAIAGVFRGVVNPSRDVLLRSHVPPGTTGAVFGFVTTGFNVGLGTAPILYGWVMDRGAAGSRDATVLSAV